MASPKSSGGGSRSPKWHKGLRWLAIAALSLVGLVLVLVLGTLTYVATPSGGERLRKLVVEKANATIEGAIAVQKLSLRGGHLMLEGLELRDPDGEMVASVAALEVRLRLTALVRKRLDVMLVRLDGQELHLEQDESGSNLERAIAERNPTPKPEKASEKSGVGLILEDIEIAHGVVDVVQRSAGTSRHIHLDDLVAHGSAKAVGDALGARLDMTGNFAAPFEGPFHLGLVAAGAGERKDARLALELGTAKLVATGHMEDESRADVRIESLLVPPEIARAFSSSYPLRAVASLSAEAKRNGDELSLRLEAKAASATAQVDGDFNLATQRTHRTTVVVRHVDLSELTDDGPSSDIALSLEASGGGNSLDDLVGRLEMSVPSSPMAGETMGPVHVLATAKDAEVQLPELLINVPGVRIEARGRASKDRLALGGKLLASDLRALSRTLGKLAGPKGISLKGQGQLSFAVAGLVEHPSLEADGSFPVLAYQKNRVGGLALHVDTPDLKVPTGTKARVTARTLALAPRKVFRAVHLEVDGSGRELSLDAAVHGYAELALRAQATLSPDGHAGTLNALSLRYPEAQWTLEAPVQIESRPGLLALSPLTLRSGEEAVSARVLERGTKLDASLGLRSFDLGKLPRAFVDPALALGGILNVEVRAKGSSGKPDVVAKVDLQGGRFKKYRNVQLRLDASYAKDEAKGTIAANGEGIKLTGAFDLPVKALRQGRHVPVKMELEVPEFRLDESLRQLGLEKPISGLLSAQVSLRGTADDPRLEAAFKGRRLQVKQLRPTDMDVALASADDGRLGARVDLTLEGKKSFVEMRTPFTVGQVIRKPPNRAALMSAEFVLEADVRELPLKLLSEAGLSDEPLDGALSARAHVTGTAMSPAGEVSVSGKGIATQGLKALDASIHLRAADDLRVDMRAEQRGKAVFTANARVGAGPKQLNEPDRLAQAALSLDASVGPLSLSELQAALQPTDVDPARAPPKIRGTLAGQLAVGGTLQDPRVVLRTRVDGLGAERSPDGRVALNFDYVNAKETLDLLLKSQNKGELHAAAAAQVDLSYPAVTRTRGLDTTPVDATLTAKDFDPGFLSHLTGAVAKVGGLLYADARLTGTMRSPAVKGRLEWKDGLLSTHGNGDFTNIHLLAIGDNDRIELKELSAKSGSGTAKLSALATRTGSKEFKLHAAAEMNKFPVMSQGQVAATLSIRSTADGAASPTSVSIKNLDIPEAHVQLPDVQRKDVQKLDDPPDVLLTVNGKPIRGTKAKSPGEASAAAEPGDSGSGSAEPGSSGSERAGAQVTVLVNAPRNLWIQGNDINTEIGLSDGFRVEYATAPKVFGDVNVLRGRLDVFGRRFDLQRDSKISFTGPALQPDLNVTATYKNEIEQVTVYLKVQGEAEKLQLQPTSEPPLPETEIYTLLATGHTSLHHGTGKSSPAGEAASLVGSAAASQLKKTLSGKLPLDVLSIEAGDSGIAGSKLEAGTYVNDRFYVGFTGRIGADPMRGENSNEVELEYQLSKHWSVNGSYGDARAGGAGVNWRKDY